ncbi:uncharacterized protein LOC110860731 [Folsomia candida]|uniref:GTP-binding protein A n=1 Tax=Folsomia candida TaxID=158441 RepID=A0A226D4T9_FOLCA|nr:uncharacterized protein LOC110860731 [Folsomia candida]OXA40249.1 GTP-binding protein A [Folsomia candida]
MATTVLGESSPREFTILLLGETGVGKSTWINGFANFLLHSDLSSAEESPIHCVIPTSFIITDEDYKEKLVSVGQDMNEVMETGQSATQLPQSYLFPRDGYMVRLIDTPGIGDVRGVKQDKKNFERILDHISHLESLHAICILLKPNNARLGIMFQFCIKELLTHLHKDACANIVFCFTNSRSTFYRPGDTLPSLRKLLEENQHVSIPLDRSTIYCMDNEAIRFLYAIKNGVAFDSDERKNYIASWDKSVGEINRLLERAESSPPHSVQSTLSLNTARQTILSLGSPMAEVTRNIQLNIATQQAQMESVKNSEKSQEELSRNLVHKVYEVRMHQLLEPRTICTAAKCTDVIEVGGVKDTNYKSHCHTNCGTGKQKHFKIGNIKGHKNLRKCSAFNPDGLCKRCNCSWKEHMKITYETSLVEKEVKDIEKQMELQYQEDSTKKIEKHIKEMGVIIDELRQEQEEITDASIEFAKFLRLNAITVYNNAMDEYIGHFIHDERNKMASPGGGNPKIYEGLIKLQADYRNQMETLDKAMRQNSCGPPLTPIELDQLIKRLYRMKHNGKLLMEMMETSQSSADSCYTEKLVGRNASFTTVTKRPRKKGKLLNEFVQWINPGNPSKSGERSQLEYGKNRQSDDSALTKSLYKPSKGHKFSNSIKQNTAGEFGRQENNYAKNDGPASWVKVMYPIAYRQPKEDSPQTRSAPTSKRQPPPPPPKPLTSQSSTPPSSPLVYTSGNDYGDHYKSSMPEITEERANLMQDIRNGLKLKKTDTANQNRANIPPRDGNADGMDLLRRTLAMRAARFQDDDEWN